MDKIYIYRIISGQEFAFLQIPLNSKCIYHNELMSTEYVQLQFCHTDPAILQLGDYVKYNNITFKITEITPPQRTTGGYQYEQKFTAAWVSWSKRRLLYDRGGSVELGWKMTQFPKYFLELIVNTINDEFGASYTYSVDDEFKQMMACNFENSTDIISALNTMADVSHWATEWWVDSENEVLHFGVCERDTESYPIKTLTDGTEVKSVTRNQGQNSNKTTRLYAFGSTKNISSYYRKSLIFTAQDANALAFAKETAIKAGYSAGVMDSARPITSEVFDTSCVSTEDDITTTATFDPSLNAVTQLPAVLTSDIFFTETKNCARIISVNGLIDIYAYSIRRVRDGKDDWSEEEVLYNGEATANVKIELIDNSGTTIASATKTLTNTNSYIAQSTEFTLPEIYSAAGTSYTLKASVTDMSVVVAGTATKQTPAHIEFTIKTFSVNIQGTQQVITSQIEFGDYKYNCVINPLGASSLEDAFNVIAYNGVQIAAGQQYTLSHIIKRKVPSGYFTSTDKAVEAELTDPRLLLPSGTTYVDAKDDMTAEEIVEGMLIYDDIYPRENFEVSRIIVEPKSSTDPDTKIVKKWNIYSIVTDNLVFSEDYRIDNTTLQVTFQTGNLAGMIFDVNYHDNEWNTIDGQLESWFEIVRNTTYGMELPADDNYKPKAGNKYILSGFDTSYVDEKLVGNAENELLNAARQTIQELPKDTSTYELQLDITKCFGYNYKLGQRVKFESERYGTYDSRIRAIENELSGASITYTIGAHVRYSRYSEFLQLLNQGKAATLYVRGSGDATTGATLVDTDYSAWVINARISGASVSSKGGSIQLQGRATRSYTKTWKRTQDDGTTYTFYTYGTEAEALTWETNIGYIENSYLIVPQYTTDIGDIDARTITLTATYGDTTQIFTITQEPYMDIQLEILYDGETQQVSTAAQNIGITLQKTPLTGDIAYSVSSVSWLRVTNVTKTSDDTYTYTIAVDKNSVPESRTGTITFTGENGGLATATIIQRQADDIPVRYGVSNTDIKEVPTDIQTLMIASTITLTTPTGGNIVYVIVPAAVTLASWVNSIDTTEDLVQLGEIQEKTLTGSDGTTYTCYYYYAPISVQTSYNVTLAI